MNQPSITDIVFGICMITAFAFAVKKFETIVNARVKRRARTPGDDSTLSDGGVNVVKFNGVSTLQAPSGDGFFGHHRTRAIRLGCERY